MSIYLRNPCNLVTCVSAWPELQATGIEYFAPSLLTLVLPLGEVMIATLEENQSSYYRMLLGVCWGFCVCLCVCVCFVCFVLFLGFLIVY